MLKIDKEQTTKEHETALLNLTYLFCIYSILGWIVEVIFFYLKTGKYNKRGILNGAYCPLYGFSLAVCTVLTQSVRNNLFIMILICGTVCTVFELLTGVVFYKLLNHKMWDYTERPMNIGGYVCLSFTIIWGTAAAVCVKYLNPLILIGNSAADIALKTVFCIALCAFMIADICSFIKIR